MKLACALVAASIAVPMAIASDLKVISTKAQKVGNGWARVYVAVRGDGHPLALGVSLDKDALEGLPKEPNLTSRCFDKNGNGKMEHDECLGDYNFTFMI